MQNRLMVKRAWVLLIVLSLAVFSFAGIAGAQDVVLAPVAIADVVATTVDYPLPYPGVLPDNPVYFLKVWRDQIVTFLISDPVQKSFYLLLLSDKRLSASETLVNFGKRELGATTAIKSEDYLKQATDLTVMAKNSGKDVSDLLAKLIVAGAKHDEVLATLAAKVSGNDGVDLQKARQSNSESQKRILELLLVTGH